MWAMIFLMAKSEYPLEVNSLGGIIRKSRMDKGWTLLKVSKMVGISESYLARIEADKQKPKIKTMAIIANILKITPQAYYLFWFKDQIPENSPTWKHLISTFKDSSW